MPKTSQKIFDHFFSTKESGTGLGLAVVNRVIKAHDGFIELKSEPGAMTNASMSFLDNRIKSPEVKDLALYQILKSALYDGLQSEEQNAYDRFKNENQNEAYLTQIATMLNKWERLGVGKTAPGFEYADIEGNEISLDDMKGKVVYIDVWATWCGPCRVSP